MTLAPWLQEPIYTPSPWNGNAIMAWMQANGAKCYLSNTGDMAFNLPQAGQWVPDANAPAIPRGDGTSIANDPANPNERWVPDASVASDPIWQAFTLYGKAGYDFYDLSPLAQQVLADLRAHPEPIPAEIINPPPPPAPKPVPLRQPPAGFWEYLAEMRARFDEHF